MFSIIIPLYNKADYIAETLKSVLNQTYCDYEVIVVNDSSTDNSLEVASSFQDERIHIYTKENEGVSAARNYGIMHAKYDYIAFLDADDIWMPDKLSTQLEYIKEVQKTSNPQAGFVFMGYEFADEKGSGLGKIVHVPRQIHYKEALKNTTIFTSTVMIDRKWIPDEDIYMPCIESEDTATWWQILKKHGTGYGIDANLVKYRRSAKTLSSNKLTAIRRIWNLYRKQEGFGIVVSMYYMFFWAYRAVLRRI